MDLKLGDVILYRRKTLLSKAIQWFQKFKYSHASLCFNVSGKILVSEANPEGLQASTVDQSIKGSEIIVMRPLFDFDSEKLNIFIASSLGRHRYNYFKLIFVQAIWQITGRWILDESKNDNIRRVICGEWVEYCFFKNTNKIEFSLWYRATPETIFKSELFKRIY